MSERVNVEIECHINMDGNVRIHVASILYDLWDDFIYFRKEAESVDRNLDGLRYKRLMRASINAFYSYLDGVLNQWIAKLDPLFGFDHASIGKKIGFVRNRIRNGRKLPWLDLDTSRSLRNKICHRSRNCREIAGRKVFLGRRSHRQLAKSCGYSAWDGMSSERSASHARIHRCCPRGHLKTCGIGGDGVDVAEFASGHAGYRLEGSMALFSVGDLEA